jgi:hypothetical protein
VPCNKGRTRLFLPDRGVTDLAAGGMAADERQAEPLLANQLVGLASIPHSAVTKNVTVVSRAALYKKSHKFSGSNSCQCCCGKFFKVRTGPLNMKKS